MNLPGFTGELSLGKSTRTYRGKHLYGSLSQSQGGMPASVVPTQLGFMEGLEGLEEGELMGELEVEEMMGGLEDLGELEVEEMEAEETELEEELDI